VYHYISNEEACNVTLPRNPLRINVGFLAHTPIGTSRDIHFEYPEILLKPDFRLSDFSGIARAGRTPQGILIQGNFQGKSPAECVRCLTNFELTLHATFDELYAFDERSITESELILPEDANIDLEPLVREYLLIEMPISPICKSDCLGLCPVCGQNRNELPPDHNHPEEE
jgi:uncharacterized protein